MIWKTVLGVCLMTQAWSATAGEPAPAELGLVRWERGFDAALSRATRENKAAFVLFQEIPGCATCRNYGADVLSHPLLVEAIETEFVPVAIRNNTTGDDDERVLKSFREPAWNNPVARIIDGKRREVVPRLDGVYTLDGVAAALLDALAAAKREPPAYLRLLAAETSARKHGVERATFGMHCFWEGEAKLGELDGVIQTRPGFVGGMEVVELEFDPRVLSYGKLVATAGALDCATRVFARSEAQVAEARKFADSRTLPAQAIVRSDEELRVDRHVKYYLSRTPLRFVPMTETQAARVNAALARRADPASLLSPRQVAMWKVAEKSDGARSSAIGVDVREAWRAFGR